MAEKVQHTPQSRPAVATVTTIAPTGGWVTVARFYHLLIALVGTVTLVTTLTVAMTAENNGGALNGAVFSLSYFTIWSNILTMVVTWWLVARPTADSAMFRWLRLTTLVMITVTGLVYAIVLAPLADPQGINVYTNAGLHYFVPWTTVLGFLLFGPRPRFRVVDVWKMLIIPVIWLAYTLLRGLLLVTPPVNQQELDQTGPQHWYPYPFIDAEEPSALVPGLEYPGYAGVGVNIFFILLLGLFFGFLFLGLDRLLSGGHKPPPLPGAPSAGAPEPNDAASQAPASQALPTQETKPAHDTTADQDQQGPTNT